MDEREKVAEALTSAIMGILRKLEADIRADEREAAARLCDEVCDEMDEEGSTSHAYIAERCAAAIRARSET